MCRLNFSGLVCSVLCLDDSLIKIKNKKKVWCMFLMFGESDLVDSFVFGHAEVS